MKTRSLFFQFLKYYVYATCLFFRNADSEIWERHVDHDLVGLICFSIHLITPCPKPPKLDTLLKQLMPLGLEQSLLLLYFLQRRHLEQILLSQTCPLLENK